MNKSVKLKNGVYLDYQSVYKPFDYIQTGSDLDTYITAGYYLGNQTQNISNSPDGGSTIDGLLVVDRVKSDLLFATQTFYGSNGYIYKRIYWFGAYWTGWSKL